MQAIEFSSTRKGYIRSHEKAVCPGCDGASNCVDTNNHLLYYCRNYDANDGKGCKVESFWNLG